MTRLTWSLLPSHLYKCEGSSAASGRGAGARSSSSRAARRPCLRTARPVRRHLPRPRRPTSCPASWGRRCPSFRAVGGGVYIVGNDDDVDVPGLMRRGAHTTHFRSGTLFGVYEFLVRFVGVCFYISGEMGTVVPRTRRIAARARFRSACRVAPVFSLHIRRKMPRRAGIWYNSRKIEGAIWKRN
mgnify:CR=1 FL=1